MAKILSLDTSTQVCSIAIHDDSVLIGVQSYHLQKSHSNLLPAIIDELLLNCELSISDIEAVAIGAGPGSYTGLRIGTSTAKGLTYTLGIPLISVSSLDSMIAQIADSNQEALLCPMLDARRMEVYCKIVDQQRETIWKTQSLIVDESSFDEFVGKTLLLFGNGSAKLKPIFAGVRFHYIDNISPNAEFMGEIAHDKFQRSDFEDVAYFEPNYLKAYRTNTPSQKFKV